MRLSSKFMLKIYSSARRVAHPHFLMDRIWELKRSSPSSSSLSSFPYTSIPVQKCSHHFRFPFLESIQRPAFAHTLTAIISNGHPYTRREMRGNSHRDHGWWLAIGWRKQQHALITLCFLVGAWWCPEMEHIHTQGKNIAGSHKCTRIKGLFLPHSFSSFEPFNRAVFIALAIERHYFWLVASIHLSNQEL